MSEHSQLLTGKRAVIVEDEGITQMHMRRALTQAGLVVVGIAGNGKEGVEMVLRETPDLVLMDVAMPGMNGFEASRQILAKQRVCIVMLTAFAAAEYQRLAQEIGTSGFIAKPITAETLLPQLEAAYAEYERSRAARRRVQRSAGGNVRETMSDLGYFPAPDLIIDDISVGQRAFRVESEYIDGPAQGSRQTRFATGRHLVTYWEPDGTPVQFWTRDMKEKGKGNHIVFLMHREAVTGP